MIKIQKLRQYIILNNNVRYVIITLSFTYGKTQFVQTFHYCKKKKCKCLRISNLPLNRKRIC